MNRAAPQHICFLTEAGTEIGLGHMMRCMAVAASFRADGHRADILVDVNGTLPDISSPHIVTCPWRRSPTRLSDILDGVDQVVIDSYLADRRLYADISQQVPFSVALDDFDRIAYPVDLVINPNPYADQMSYGAQQTEVIGGSEFVILRPAFLPLRNAFTIKDSCNTLFVTVGGDDYRNMLPKLVPELAERGYQLRVVAGSRADVLRAQCADQHTTQIFDYLTAPEMARQMIHADVAISAGGQTLHELAFLGVPTIGICIDHDQERSLAAYVRSGFLPCHIDWNQDNLVHKIWAELQKLKPPAIRQSRSKAGQDMVDEHGPSRVRRAVFDRAT